MNYTIRQLFVLVVTLAILVFVGAWFFNSRQPHAVINGQTFVLEIASEDKLRSQGLSGRSSMAHDRGMIFIFDEKLMYPFWMKGMEFDLDFIWLDDDTVIGVTTNVKAPVNNNNEVITIAAPEPVNRIIEFNAGIIDELDVQIGDTIELNNL